MYSLQTSHKVNAMIIHIIVEEKKMIVQLQDLNQGSINEKCNEHIFSTL